MSSTRKYIAFAVFLLLLVGSYHPNLSNPGTVAQVGSALFGVIRATRAPTGDAGSSRQIQFAMKLIF